MTSAPFRCTSVWAALLVLAAGVLLAIPGAASAAPKPKAPTLKKLTATTVSTTKVELRWTKQKRGTVLVKLKRKKTLKAAAKKGRVAIRTSRLPRATKLSARLCATPKRCGKWRTVTVKPASTNPGGDQPNPGPGPNPQPNPGPNPDPNPDPPTPNPLEPRAAPAMETDAIWPPAPRALSPSACAGPLIGSNRTFDVGPGKQHEEMDTVPWLTLQPGDVVNIHARFNADGTPKPYRTKVGMQVRATADKPVYVNGVTDGDCRRPVIDGDGARTANDAAAARFGSYGQSADKGAQGLAVFLLWALGTPETSRHEWTPSYITFQGLEIRNARSTKTFKDSLGNDETWDQGASGIYAIRVNHLTVENCLITDSDQGVFTNTRMQNTVDHSDFTILRRNVFARNGTGHPTEHNAYIQSRRSLYEGNRFGAVWGGSSLKDRGSGTVVRFNHIDSSARAIDLVETEEEYGTYIVDDPLKDYAWVYGNVIRTEPALAPSQEPSQLAARPIHFGHDKSDPARSRGKTLFYYGNTYLHRAPVGYYWTTMFQLGGNDDDVPYEDQQVEASGNVFWSDSGATIWRFNSSQRAGQIVLRGTNYRPENWLEDEQTAPLQFARRNADRTWQLSGGQPIWDTTAKPLIATAGSVQLFGDTSPSTPSAVTPQLDETTLRPLAGSPLRDRGIAGPSSTPAGVVAANLGIEFQPGFPAGVVARPVRGAAADLGALEGD